MIAFTPETYSVKYGTERDNLESFSSPVQSGTNFRAVNLPFSVTVTGLMPQTVYYYQLVTSNSIGNRTGEIQSCEFIKRWGVKCSHVSTYLDDDWFSPIPMVNPYSAVVRVIIIII